MDHRRLRERLAAQRGEPSMPSSITSQAASGAEAEVDWHARVAHLRTLIQRRRQRLDAANPARWAENATSTQNGDGQAQRIETQQPSHAAELGRSVADGVRLVEQELAAGRSLPAPREHGEVCCFDTETTGLRGGAGLWVWMVGSLSWTGSHWRLRQWWLERPGAERAYLHHVLADLGQGDGPLVSFNGKSYDLPHLGTRLDLSGMANPLPQRAHLDLLHLCRRQHGRDWPDCRLRTAEARLLGLQRVDDLPGSEAPRSWRDYLHLGNSHGVARVLVHNRQDLLSLARLLPLLCERVPNATGGDSKAVGRC